MYYILVDKLKEKPNRNNLNLKMLNKKYTYTFFCERIFYLITAVLCVTTNQEKFHGVFVTAENIGYTFSY